MSTSNKELLQVLEERAIKRCCRSWRSFKEVLQELEEQ
jgi:hypothetical protein